MRQMFQIDNDGILFHEGILKFLIEFQLSLEKLNYVTNHDNFIEMQFDFSAF